MRVIESAVNSGGSSRKRNKKIMVVYPSANVDEDPFMVGEFVAYCSSRLCFGTSADEDDAVRAAINDDETREYRMPQQQRPSLVSSSRLDPPGDSLEAVFREELEASKALGGAGGSCDDWSCDSSLSSTGIMSMTTNSIVSYDTNSLSGRKKKIKKQIQVVVDPKVFGRSAPRRSGTSRSLQFLDRVDERSKGSSSKSSSSASAPISPFNLRDPKSNHQAKQSVESKHHRRNSSTSQGDSNSCRSCKTEGAQPNTNMWMSLSVLDQDRFNHRVLGTSLDDDATKPLVLNMSIMDDLQQYLPYSKQGEMFWLKYSMVRDGASLGTVLHKTRLSAYTILAVETLDGEIFGAFTARPWHITWKYYGTPESFLWRVPKPRQSRNRDEARSSSRRRFNGNNHMEVFRFAGNNPNVQLCNVDRIAVGGGGPDEDSVVSDDLSHVKLTEWGFGLAFGKNLQQGTSSPCITFNSPSLSTLHDDGSCFEVANMEFWTLTPCINVEEAERLEEGKHFVEGGAMSVNW